MLGSVIIVVFAMLGLSLLLNIWRLFKGPSVPDRILALDTMYINSNNMNTYAQHAPMVPTLWLFLQIEFIPQLFQM